MLRKLPSRENIEGKIIGMGMKMVYYGQRCYNIIAPACDINTRDALVAV